MLVYRHKEAQQCAFLVKCKCSNFPKWTSALPDKKRLILPLTFGLAMLVSGMMSDGSATSTDTLSKQDIARSQSALIATSSYTIATTTIPTNAGIEAKVRVYFSDIPVMAEVSRCESHYRQYDKVGNIFRGKVNNKDVGVMQINEYYHLKRAQKLGYDIYTVEGNLAYGRLLYEEQGTQPWSSSSPCWAKTAAAKADYAAKAELVVSKANAAVKAEAVLNATSSDVVTAITAPLVVAER